MTVHNLVAAATAYAVAGFAAAWLFFRYGDAEHTLIPDPRTKPTYVGLLFAAVWLLWPLLGPYLGLSRGLRRLGLAVNRWTC